MTKISILTNVYNGERFISETIESVLHQTDPNFKYYIRLNACTDRSEEIVRSYAEKDNRIVVLKNDVNYVTDEGIPYVKRGFWPKFDSEYVAILDHDDFLDSHFVEKMYEIGHASNAEMVICGCAFCDDVSRKLVGLRTPPVFSGTSSEFFSEHFIKLYGSLRTLWAKIFRTDCFDASYDELFSVPANFETCMDTWFILGFLEKYKNIISTDEILLLYRKNVVSQYFDKKPAISRIGEGQALFHKGEQLLKGVNALTESNYIFLHDVLISHLYDLIKMTVHSSAMTNREKLEYFQLILKDSEVQNCRLKFIFAVTAAICKSILPMARKDDDLSLWDFYLYRLAYLLQYGNRGSEDFIIYWSILMDPENTLSFGLDLAGSMSWQITAPWTKRWLTTSLETQLFLLRKDSAPLLDKMLTINTEETLLIQRDIINAMDQNDWDTVSEKLTQLDSFSPINEIGLFARIMLFSLHGENLMAKKISAAAIKIFPESTALQNIYNDLTAV